MFHRLLPPLVLVFFKFLWHALSTVKNFPLLAVNVQFVTCLLYCYLREASRKGYSKYVSSYSRSTYNTYICGTLFLYALLATALSLANRIYLIGSKRQEPIK